MKKFIILYHAPKGAMDAMKDASPEDMKDGMKPWMDWAEKCGEGLVDIGTPLANAHMMTKESHGSSESSVVGYSILQAESWDKLKEMLENHPHMGWVDGCSIEVHECMPLPGM